MSAASLSAFELGRRPARQPLALLIAALLTAAPLRAQGTQQQGHPAAAAQGGDEGAKPTRGGRPAAGSKPAAAARGAAKGAAGAAPDAVVQYRPLRFDEDWSRLPSSSRDWLDRMKSIPIDPSGWMMLRVGGQLRARAEGVDRYQLVAGADRNDAYGATREMLWGDLHFGSAARAFVELRNAQSVSRDLPGGARTSDYDLVDLENAFVELGRGPADRRSFVRVGRQELSWGRERVVGVSDWSNSRTTYQGVDARWAFAPLTAGLVVVEPVTIRSRAPDLGDTLALYRGAYLDGNRVGVLSDWQVYSLKLDSRDAVRAGRAGDRHELTTGARVALGGAGSRWRFDGEGALQRGRLTDTPVRAWFVASDLTWLPRRVAGSPQIAAGFDWASGGGDTTRLTTYTPPTTTGHSHAGYMDIIGRANLAEARGGVTVRPSRTVSVHALQHWFWRASADAPAFSKSMTVLRAPGTSRDRALGGETDLTATWRLTRRLRIEPGLGYFAPGAFLLGAPTPARASTWTFLSTTYTF